jgi:hypothetical protein
MGKNERGAEKSQPVLGKMVEGLRKMIKEQGKIIEERSTTVFPPCQGVFPSVSPSPPLSSLGLPYSPPFFMVSEAVIIPTPPP